MKSLDKQYKDIVYDIYFNAEQSESDDRTGVGTSRVFNRHIEVDIRVGFPLISLKETFWRTAFVEMIWMLRGETNISSLVNQGVNIWNDWPLKKFNAKNLLKENIDMTEFISRIKNSESFANEWGELGPVYGAQWRNWNGIDQLVIAINQILTNPNSRRIIIEGWNVSELDDMALPPCHKTYQFTVVGNLLNLTVYQRSADMFLGVPFNLANAGLMLELMAKTCKLIPAKLHWFGVDCHLYDNHNSQVLTLLERQIIEQTPTIHMDISTNILDVNINQLHINNYNPQDAIAAPVAV